MIDEKLIFTNSRGQSISFGNAAPFILLNHDGTGGVQADIQRQKSPYQDGVSYIDTVMQERPINFQLVIMASNQNELFSLRSQLVSVMNPKLGEGKLVYQRGEMKHEIKAAVELAPVFPNGEENRGATFQVALVSLLCPSPFWEEINPEIVKLEDFVANFRFKFHFPVRFSVRGDSRVLINKGDVPTPIQVMFRGESLNPKITNITTGEFLKVNRQIPPGYSLMIDTSFNGKAVEIVAPDGVRENAFGSIDLESTFFSLEVGENKFAFITDGGRPEVFVTYKHRYVGV
ncbi:phage distal tail protein [Heyndrickxia oleronia]|uniref:phage distal tail protein n=1 Tax=Heyndrickxia oleronia TaxID=38875 RepID=UPI001C0F2601|nr:phage tail domain-containing protein [Heyndrickxia oleronia]MBU5214557.1 phage tail family protein [Heyndrickxia oleronia]